MALSLLPCHTALKQGLCDFRMNQTSIITRRLHVQRLVRDTSGQHQLIPLAAGDLISYPHCPTAVSFLEPTFPGSMWRISDTVVQRCSPDSDLQVFKCRADEALDIGKKFLHRASKQA